MKTILSLLIAIVVGSSVLAQSASPTMLRLHPDNPHYFEWRGKLTPVVSSGEHYGAVLNLEFDYIQYLDALAKDGLNHTRTFSGTYREVFGSFNITDNTLAPKPGQYICPWARSDQPGAADGGNKFDLTRWDDKYFARLKDFVKQAADRGIIVELDLFCPMYEAGMWNVCPMQNGNNINGIGDAKFEDALTLIHDDLTQVQVAVAKKIVQELKAADNIYFEICNEPYALNRVPMEFQHRIIEAVVEVEKDLPQKHLISLNIQNGRAKVVDPHPAVSIFNFHYCIPPDTVDMNWNLNKLIGENETGFRGGRPNDDLLYRTEGWAFMFAGGGLYNNLDYSFTTSHPDGSFVEHRSPGGGTPALRKQLGVLKKYLDQLDLVRMQPDNDLVKSTSTELLHEALAIPGKDYVVYLYPRLNNSANRRSPLPAPGKIETELTLALPAGKFNVVWTDTISGTAIESTAIDNPSSSAKLKSPVFENDVVVRLTKAN